MKIAFVYFPDFTLLDVVGVYDPLLRLRSLRLLPDLSIEHRAFHPASTDPEGWLPPTAYFPETVGSPAPLRGYDLLFVPGGWGTRPLTRDADFLNWLRTGADTPLITSVCTGSLLLGAAGLLKTRRATTHFNEYETLAPYVGRVVREDLVHDGKFVTAGAVASSLTLGLYLCGMLAGEAAVAAVRRSMHYQV